MHFSHFEQLVEERKNESSLQTFFLKTWKMEREKFCTTSWWIFQALVWLWFLRFYKFNFYVTFNLQILYFEFCWVLFEQTIKVCKHKTNLCLVDFLPKKISIYFCVSKECLVSKTSWHLPTTCKSYVLPFYCQNLLLFIISALSDLLIIEAFYFENVIVRLLKFMVAIK